MVRFKSVGRNLFRKERVERELDAEVRAFVEMKTDEKIAAGMTHEEARRAALLECGGIEQVKESVRQVRAGALLEQSCQDVRFGLRMLRKNPGFTIVAVLTIALGIGVNTGIFAIINALALHPLPVTDPGRVVAVYQLFRGGEGIRNVHGESSLFSYPEYLEYREHNEVFSAVMVYTPLVRGTLTANSHQIPGQLTSCNYFDVLRAPIAMGRGFLPAECATDGGDAVVVLSDPLWRSDFGADPSIIGKTIRINRQPLQVVGIAAPTFVGTEIIASSFWVPITMQQALEGSTTSRVKEDNLSWLVMMGRLKDGVTLDQARAQLGVIASRIDQRHPGRITKLSVNTATVMGTPDERKIVLGVGTVLLIAVGLVLLIVCANVANLMLARATGRRREFAVRLALGAGKGRIVRQLVTESLLLSAIGGMLALVVAVWASKAAILLIARNLPAGIPAFAIHVAPDLRVFVYTFALALLTGIIFGVAPARQATRPDVNRELKGNALDAEGGRKNLLRHALVAAQVAFCTLLLISAGLLLRGLAHAELRDPGFETDHLAVATFNLAAEGYKAERANAFHRQLEDRLRGMPGVDGVAEAALTQINGGRRSEQYQLPGGREWNLNFNVVSPEYFELLGIPLVRGRNFTRAEASAGAGLAIVTESTARALWPGEDPVGKHIVQEPKTDLEIVGVARDSDTVHLGRSDEPYLYQLAGPADQLDIQVLVHHRTEFAAAADSIRAAARDVDSEVTLQVAPLHDNLELFLSASRMGAVFAGFMAALALAIATIGIYGTVAYSVGKRTREIGIRIALGARNSDVIRMVVRQVLNPVAAGAAAGIVASLAASQLLTLLLFGLNRFDVLAYGSVVAFLSAVALLASYIPARKALRVDPIAAIRSE